MKTHRPLDNPETQLDKNIKDAQNKHKNKMNADEENIHYIYSYSCYLTIIQYTYILLELNMKNRKKK